MNLKSNTHENLSNGIATKAKLISQYLEKFCAVFPEHISAARGIGLLQGLVFNDPVKASQVSGAAFKNGLIVELCGPNDNVLKIMPPLTIEDDILVDGLNLLSNAIFSIFESGCVLNFQRNITKNS